MLNCWPTLARCNEDFSKHVLHLSFHYLNPSIFLKLTDYTGFSQFLNYFHVSQPLCVLLVFAVSLYSISVIQSTHFLYRIVIAFALYFLLRIILPCVLIKLYGNFFSCNNHNLVWSRWTEIRVEQVFLAHKLVWSWIESMTSYAFQCLLKSSTAVLHVRWFCPPGHFQQCLVTFLFTMTW